MRQWTLGQVDHWTTGPLDQVDLRGWTQGVLWVTLGQPVWWCSEFHWTRDEGEDSHYWRATCSR
ncbi:hypothetical protein Hamer_G016423 [Homarus americanus]|uniref:Uncharacterized protein n=1 Tax=Homarus americanus TaxID=6706 RepID=A0A8J5THK7_HOMAM|nr:hypothetical protein Hamer_G016423 [Homarus americanus]